VETIRVSDEMNVDISPDGTVYGIELLNANAQLEAEDNGNLVVINEAVGMPAGIGLNRSGWTGRVQDKEKTSHKIRERVTPCSTSPRDRPWWV